MGKLSMSELTNGGRKVIVSRTARKQGGKIPPTSRIKESFSASAAAIQRLEDVAAGGEPQKETGNHNHEINN